MKKTALAFVAFFLFALTASAQSTTVSGTITDAGSQTWNNGTYTFTFQPNPQYPTGPYTWSGGTLTPSISGSLSGSGTYSQSVPSNSAITPAGSTWILTVTPNASSNSFSSARTTITGGTQTLNLTPAAIAINWSIPPGPAISAYADGEIVGTLPPGAEYFNTTSLLTRVWNGSSWANQGSGAGSTCGSSPGQLLYNDAGACAGTNAITTDGLGNLTVGGEVITGEILANASVGGNLALTCSPAPCTIQYGSNGANVTSEFTGSVAAFMTSTGVTINNPTGGAEGAGTLNATGLYINGVAVSAGSGANTALSNLAAVAINAALLPGTTNSIALGASNDYWTNVYATNINCGIAANASCLITGAGSTSGTATITWPAVASITSNPLVFSNAISVPSCTGCENISFPQTVGGTVNSGGIPYFSSTTQMSSSAALAANGVVLGGGAGTAPATNAGLTYSAGTLSCGVAGTAGCVISGKGATSGSATITWPAVAGTAANPILFSNSVAIPTATNLCLNQPTCTSNLADSSGSVTLEAGNTFITAFGGGNGLSMYPSQQISFNSSGFAKDTSLSRGGAGIVDVGTGAAGSAAGTINASGYQANGTAGISAGSFSAITAIQSTDGLITTLTGTSDALLKTNIHPFVRGLNAVMKLHPSLYRWNEKGQEITKFAADLEQAGFVAQDVKRAIPEAVGLEEHGGTDYLTISDRPILAALVNAVKEQQKEIEELKRELASKP